jgi:2-oxo-3-hexenedioate decarboxylase
MYMKASELLEFYDSGKCWPSHIGEYHHLDNEKAYQIALDVRSLRQKRGERALGYKIGFTNRSIWPLYNVYSPMWGSVWDTTVSHSVNGLGSISLDHICQPRIEPEIVFGFKSTPKPSATIDDLYEAIDWIAPGFEIVQSHMPDWKFSAEQTVLDSGLHAKLCIGDQHPIRSVSSSARELIQRLSGAKANLYKNEVCVDSGIGSNVLDSPLNALLHFLELLRACPGATDIKAGDVVTTGTWTDAWPVKAGERWGVQFDFENLGLKVQFN